MDMEREQKAGTYTPYQMAVIMERMHAINTSAEVIDYGDGKKLYSVEAHILSSIAEHPGTFVTELAQEWNRTKGTISQILKKLEGKNLVYRKYESRDKRKASLYVTEEGMSLHQKHMNYDTESYQRFFEELSRYYSKERIWQTFEVLEKWIELEKEWFSVWKTVKDDCL